MLRTAEDFYNEGSKVFHRAPVNRQSIQGWIGISKGKIADAQRKENSTTTRLGAAYDAILNLSLAILSSRGWRAGAAEGHHHVQTLEAACAYAGVTQAVFDQLDAIRDLRNNQYQGIEPSEGDVKLALSVLERLVPQLLHLLSS